MKLTSKTEYGLVSLSHLARRMDEGPLTIKELAAKEGYAVPYIEKIFQQLRKAGIVTSYQGVKGGYVLARSPSEITVKDVIEALEDTIFDVFCDPQCQESIICNHDDECGLRPVWRKAQDVLDTFFDSVTLETIILEESRAKKELVS